MPCEKRPWPRQGASCSACLELTWHYVMWEPRRENAGLYPLCYECIKDLNTGAAVQDKLCPIEVKK